jgi:hypothetical protein
LVSISLEQSVLTSLRLFFSFYNILFKRVMMSSYRFTLGLPDTLAEMALPSPFMLLLILGIPVGGRRFYIAAVLGRPPANMFAALSDMFLRELLLRALRLEWFIATGGRPPLWLGMFGI